jgi:hypothetical protein
MARAAASRSRSRFSFNDREQPELLEELRRCAVEGDFIRWESLRGRLSSMGYGVVLVQGVEHLRPISG